AAPQIRSSISTPSSSGTCSSRLRTTYAARSSGRTSVSEPLNARPIGERAVCTITAWRVMTRTFRDCRWLLNFLLVREGSPAASQTRTRLCRIRTTYEDDEKNGDRPRQLFVSED